MLICCLLLTVVYMLFKGDLNYFKVQYRHIIFYSIPHSILFVVRKRLNLIFLFFMLLLFISIAVF